MHGWFGWFGERLQSTSLLFLKNELTVEDIVS
jgi:hypothetical protein